ncbi:MAG: sulfite exporter TauE/SafE family protein [Burkholderiaceae bacterium]
MDEFLALSSAWLPPAREFLILVPVIVLASFIFVTVGFGGGVIAVPIAALFIDMVFLLPVLVIIESFTVLRLLRLSHQSIVRADAVRIIPASALGTAAGVTLLVNLPMRWLMFGMAAFVASFLLARLWIKPGGRGISQHWAWPMGTLAGLSSGAFGAGGPPTAIYLSLRGHSTNALRATIATTGTANLVFRIVGFTIAGLYLNPGILTTALCLIPFAYLASRLAEGVRNQISDKVVLNLTYGILVLSAVSLFFRALWLSG